jgi:hypothetical protein
MRNPKFYPEKTCENQFNLRLPRSEVYPVGSNDRTVAYRGHQCAMRNDYFQLMSGIINLMKREEKHKASSASITQLKGLGKELWQKTDTEFYIASERESWD